MNKHVQIRNVPASKHRKLKARAASKGMTITEYVKRLIESDLDKPTWDEIAERMKQLEPLELTETSAEMIRHERDKL